MKTERRIQASFRSEF